MSSGPTFFATPEKFRSWLRFHHDSEPELIVGYYKKATGVASVDWEQSRDEALCFGWIDGVRRRLDDRSFTVRFTPRRPGSIWSRVNIERVEALEAEGRMTEAGRAAYAMRREDRSGVYSFENKEQAVLPVEYERRLRANEAAAEFFYAQPAGYRKTAIHLVISAKREETRERRLQALIADSAAGLRIKQLRR